MLRILIVEDEYLIGSLIADALEDAGYAVAAILPTGEQAVEHLRAGGIDLAILDIRLKGAMTGIDVAEVARTLSVPHLFISGSGEPSTRFAAEATGPRAFLQKPVDEASLLNHLAALRAERTAA